MRLKCRDDLVALRSETNLFSAELIRVLIIRFLPYLMFLHVQCFTSSLAHGPSRTYLPGEILGCPFELWYLRIAHLLDVGADQAVEPATGNH